MVEEVKGMRKDIQCTQQDENLPWSLQATQVDIPVPQLSLYSYIISSYFNWMLSSHLWMPDMWMLGMVEKMALAVVAQCVD